MLATTARSDIGRIPQGALLGNETVVSMDNVALRVEVPGG
jgi:hypothetical protein